MSTVEQALDEVTLRIVCTTCSVDSWQVRYGVSGDGVWHSKGTPTVFGGLQAGVGAVRRQRAGVGLLQRLRRREEALGQRQEARVVVARA